MKITPALWFVSALAANVSASSLVRRQAPNGVAKVNLATRTGKATFLGSGFIYGWPNNGVEADSTIPEYLAKDIKFNANRAGGAQTPSRGWAYGGYKPYLPRFQSTLSNYRTTRKYGGEFILLVHDLWGADGSTKNTTLHPGDNGSWTEMETFLKQLCDDIKANNMTEGLVMDIWNEPELNIFWSRSWSQYLEYYVRATRFIR